jgi:hypothetical protein
MTDLDTDRYYTHINLCLIPIFNDIPPRTRISLNDTLISDEKLSEPKVFCAYKNFPAGKFQLSIEILDKDDKDPIQAVKIQKLSLNNITDPKFIWMGTYRPRYPEPWFSQQLALKQTPKLEIKNTDYLGWNGVWILEFTTPIFTWIHQVQGLGWIYD